MPTRTTKKDSRSLFFAAVLLASATTAFAQSARDGKLMVTVVDSTGGVLPGATVTITGIDDATATARIAPLKATDKGVATLDTLTLGRYAITAEFPGFDSNTLKDVRVRSGDNKHVIVLPLKKMSDTVTVARDKQAAGADRGVTFGSALTREQIDALSDDPTEMERQLKEMAGLDAQIRVDSFEGQPLPPKAQIKSIHITRDQFAAETHSAGLAFIDIITQPGLGPLRTSFRSTFADSSLDGRNPFVTSRGPAQDRNFGGSIGGTLIKNKSNFSISMNGSNNYSTPVLHASTSTGIRSENVNLRTPNTGVSMSGNLDYAITKDQTVRMGFSKSKSTSSNQGVGDTNLPGREFSSENDNWSLRLQEAGPLGRRFFTNTRFAMTAGNSLARSATEGVTYVVPEAFTSGGAQRTGGSHTKNFTFASDLDYVRGIHSWRTGVQLDGLRFRSNSISNYLGTYTFESLDAFNAGTPRSFTKRIGDPNIAYWNVQAGMYVQDDIRLRKNLTISAGIRYEAQTHLDDYLNLGPRVGITWSPFKSGKTSLRASAGIFYDWLGTNVYQQVLQVDGFRQQEINISNPFFPEPGGFGSAPPTNRYLLDDDLQMAVNKRLSASMSQTLTKRLNLSATYANIHGRGLLVGENLNAPVKGVRSDPAFANVIRTTSDARAVQNSISTSLSMNIGSLSSGPAASAKRFDWKRGLYIYGSYGLRRAENNTDGAFSIPASGSLDAEWGPAAGDVRHSVNISLNTSALKNLSAGLSLGGSSSPPLSIRTGFDDNGDLFFNDRPAGVGRNSARTAGQWYSSANVSYSLGFGKATTAGGSPGIIMIGAGGVMSATAMPAQAAPRYRLGISAFIDNPTNHATYTGYSGVMTSKFFLQPTSAYGVRRVRFSMNLSF